MPLGPALRSSVPASRANSHIVPIGDRCGEAEHLGDAVAREIRVFSYDVLVRHALGQASRPKYTCLVGLGLTFFVSPSTHFTAGLYHSHSLDCGTTLLSTS